MKIEQCQKKDANSKKDIVKTVEKKELSISEASICGKYISLDTTIKNSINSTSPRAVQPIEIHSIIKKPINQFGDANTYFRGTLRSYKDFDFWRRCHLNFNLADTSPEKKLKRKKRIQITIRNKTDQSDTQQLQEIFKEKIASMDDIEDTETTAGEEDDINDVDEIIVKASRELEEVAEKNKHLLDLLERETKKPGKGVHLASEKTGDDGENLENDVIKQLEEAEYQAKRTANAIYELKTRVGELLKKEELTKQETLELSKKNKELKEQMVLFEESTRRIQNLIQKSNMINTKTTGLEGDTRSNNSSNEDGVDQNYGDSVNCCKRSCSENIQPTIPDVPIFAKKLSQSYSMQEKLSAENADLESIRFKLQEELLNKDQTLECLQRELGNLQNEMRLVSRENNILNDKLKKLKYTERKQKNEKQTKVSDNIIISAKLQEYSDNTYHLEKQLNEMENDVKFLHTEICAVQQEREHLEKHRKMMCASRPCMLPCLESSLNSSKPMRLSTYSQPGAFGRSLPTQWIRELNDQYDKTDNELKSKLIQVTSLKSDYEKLKKLTQEAEEFKAMSEENIRNCEKIMSELKTKNEARHDHERQLEDAKKRLMKAKESLHDQHLFINNQKKQLDELKSRFSEAQQQIEEQRQHINLRRENGVDEGFNLGSQIVSSLQNKLEEIII